MPVDHKTPVQDVDGTPVKRVILSIIADYDLKTGLCELVDNAIDQWSDRNYSGPLTTALDLDVARQVISVRDDAGGVSKDDLHLLISPGRSRNDETAELIGIFGVGGKRSVIALAERTEIKTRFRDQQTHELDITPTWIKSDDWRLPAYAIPDIEPNTTIVSLSYLRSQITDEDLDKLRVHVGQTYAWFLNKGCVITLNGESVAPMTFETWAYLADFKPRKTRSGVPRNEIREAMLDILNRRSLPTRSNVLTDLSLAKGYSLNLGNLALILDLLGYIGAIGMPKRKEQVYFPWTEQKGAAR